MLLHYARGCQRHHYPRLRWNRPAAKHCRTSALPFAASEEPRGPQQDWEAQEQDEFTTRPVAEIGGTPCAVIQVSAASCSAAVWDLSHIRMGHLDR
jgi:hypothetical protein